VFFYRPDLFPNAQQNVGALEAEIRHAIRCEAHCCYDLVILYIYYEFVLGTIRKKDKKTRN